MNIFVICAASAARPGARSLIIRIFFSAVLFALGSQPVTAWASDKAAYYVSPHGADAGDGTKAAPFLTLARAQEAMRTSNIKTTYLMSGTFRIEKPLSLVSKDAAESWLAYAGETPILDGGDEVKVAISVRADKIKISGLTLQNIGEIGILATNVDGLIVENNTIKNIHSNGWNQGGIVLIGNISNARVSHNLINESNYSGIMYANSARDIVNNLSIDHNAIYNTCSVVEDCGAIYTDDRGHRGSGVVISTNIIGNYGPYGHQNKAIYLDDEASNITVRNNIVYGRGSFAIQIHGGDHNIVQNNIFDITAAMALGLYQTRVGSTDYGMRGNVFTCNIIYSAVPRRNKIWLALLHKSDRAPEYSTNLYWNIDPQMMKEGPIVDARPVMADPKFIDPENANYKFSGGIAPDFCKFEPIDADRIGVVRAQ